MRPKPRSRFEDEDGKIHWMLVDDQPDYPEVIAWRHQYSRECDRLSELEAIKTRSRHWGRWYLTRNSLTTRMSTPKVGEDGFNRGGIYGIPLDRLAENWFEHLSAKEWIGDKGLSDLAIAISTVLEENYGNARVKAG